MWWSNKARSRESQLEAFDSSFPDAKVSVLNSSMCYYDIDVPRAGAGGTSVTLRVCLPAKFPDAAPVLQLLSRVQHQWVNAHNQVLKITFTVLSV